MLEEIAKEENATQQEKDLAQKYNKYDLIPK